MPGTRLIRILCLHGFRGSGAQLRAQLRGLTQDIESEHELELVCPDAPSLPDGRLAWWNAVPSDAGGNAKHYQGFSDSRAAIQEHFRNSGPFDGIFGFSQGAALAGLLVGLRAGPDIEASEYPLEFGFAILVGGFVSNDPTHAATYAARASYALPSLHFIGRADRIVPAEASRELAARFEKPCIAEHDGGHLIPSAPEARSALRSFLSAATPQHEG